MIWKFIKAKQFFPAYTSIKNWKHKLRGLDGNKKPIVFSEQEHKEIQVGLKRLFKDIT